MADNIYKTTLADRIAQDLLETFCEQPADYTSGADFCSKISKIVQKTIDEYNGRPAKTMAETVEHLIEQTLAQRAALAGAEAA